MNQESARTRKELKEISSVSDFETLLSRCMLCDRDKEMLRLIYIDQCNVGLVGSKVGYSDSTVKRRHAAALKKMRNLI